MKLFVPTAEEELEGTVLKKSSLSDLPFSSISVPSLNFISKMYELLPNDSDDTTLKPSVLKDLKKNENLNEVPENKEQSEKLSEVKLFEKYPQVDNMDIEDVFKLAGLTEINGKPIHFGEKKLRTWGKANSWHKVLDKITGNASARDLSISRGNEKDYQDFKDLILSNPIIMYYLEHKRWGIINESSAYVRKFTGGTGPHFHFGPDKWAVKILNQWKSNPSMAVNQFIPSR